MAIKTLQEARSNFESATVYIPERFERGVLKADWQTAAGSDEAEENFRIAITQALEKKARQKAIQAVPNNVWQRLTIIKGKNVIAQRIREALDDWARVWGPMYDQILRKRETLPRKTIDFRANINNRLVPIVEEWKRASGKL